MDPYREYVSKLPLTRRYLMCPPRHFAVEYAINPWMDPSQPVDTQRAMAQWAALRDTYRRLGHTVEEIEPQPDLPDMVFSANSATVVGGRVLGARFRAPQRTAEAEFYRRWFVEHGYREVVMPTRIDNPSIANSSPRTVTIATRSRPARTARSASSSRAAGTPHTAKTASPMNFSTVPL